MIIIGIDPGARGALVALRGGRDVVASHVLPVVQGAGLDPVEMRDQLNRLRWLGECHAVIERAQSMGRESGSAMLRYGRDYGILLGLCTALEIPYETVPPATWHRALVGGSVGDPKGRTLLTVRQLLPHLELVAPRGRKAHDGIVDAAAIALWASRR